MADQRPDNMTDGEKEALREAWIILDNTLQRRDSWHL
jgi:hypothetical protein